MAKKETTMPEGALRMAITVRGDESDEQMAALKVHSLNSQLARKCEM